MKFEYSLQKIMLLNQKYREKQKKIVSKDIPRMFNNMFKVMKQFCLLKLLIRCCLPIETILYFLQKFY